MSKFDPGNNIDDAAISLRRAEQDVEDALTRGKEARERYALAAANLKRLVDAEINATRELWSAQFRAKREADKEKERRVVTYCEVDADD